jgi:hypothetical protein
MILPPQKAGVAFQIVIYIERDMTFEDWPPLIWKGPSFKSPPRAGVVVRNGCCYNKVFQGND